jgi:peptidoglycan hydrolase-like protein with peptidoglycan-binding domain
MRHRDPLTPDELRELDALDRALAGEPVDADLRELDELVHAVRATAPAMSPAFAARLERELADGFATPGPHAKVRRPRRWMLLPAIGTLAVALAALVVALGQGGGDGATTGPSSPEGGSAGAPALEDSRASGAADSATAPARTAAPAGTASELDRLPPAVSPQPLRPPAVAKARGPRKVQRTADLVLETPAETIEATSDNVVRTVDRFDGIVASSSIGSDDSTGGEATFDLRIPTDRLDDALAALSKLGHVAERRQNLEEITGSFSSVQDRLSDARAERRGLLRALGRATTEAQIDSLRARLRIVRSTIGRLKGDLASLRRRADLSQVGVTVRGMEGGGGTSGGRWSPGDAARDALRVLEVMVGVAVVALSIALPLALLSLAITLVARAVRRRDRERALDPA